MKNYLSLILLFIIASVVGCEKNENNPLFEESWIEVSAKQDTIDFTTFMSGPAFWLRRGKVLHDDYLLPKYGSGLYRYELSGDSIGLNYTFSSIMEYEYFYFNHIGIDTFKIGNFYNPDISPGEIFTFSKMK